MDAAFLVLIVSLTAAAGLAAVAWRSIDEQRRRSAARVAALSAAIDDAGASRLKREPGSVGSLFDAQPGATVHGRPMIKAAVMAAMALTLVAFVAFSTGGGFDAVEPVAAGEAAPVELISMRHAREGDTLQVSGLVRNPRGGRMIGGVAAEVLTFDRHGTSLGTANAPLDFVSLAPGDESPFVVTIPNAGGVGRYRVSFRTAGGVIRHIDRRAAHVAAK